MEQINLNLIPNGILAVCHVSQYDNTGRKIRFHLFNGSDTYALSGTETITLRIRKTNGEILIFDIANAASDYIDLTVLQQMTDVSGVSICEFRLTDSSLDIGSFNFKMQVEPDAFDDNLSISEVSGPIATFETDLAEDLIKLDVDLEPIQDLHGYDNPWPGGGGINQITVNRTKGTLDGYYPSSIRNFEYDKYYVGLSYNNYYSESMITSYDVGNDIVSVTQSRNAYGIAFPVGVKPNHQYYIGCTFGGTVKLAASYFDSTGSLINYDYNIGASRIIMTPDNCSTLVLVVYDGAASGAPVSASNIFINDPATETSYIPYSNVCPITGHDSAQLFRTGKNLLDTRQESIPQYAGGSGVYANVTYTPNNDGSITINGTSTGASVLFFDPVTLDPLTSYPFPTWKYTNNRYTFSVSSGWGSVTGDAYIQATVKKIKDDSIVSRQRLTSSAFSRSFTVREDEYIADAFIRLSSGASASNVNVKIQLELGSTATDYEPYESDPTPVTVQFGQTIYKGKLYSEQRKVLVTHVCETYDGSSDEEWTRHSATSVRYGFRIYFQYDKKPTTQSIDEMLSSVIPLRKSSETTSVDDDIITCRSTTYLHKIFYIFAPPSKISTVEELRAFLANEPETVMYPLDEPFFIDLTQIQTASIDSTPVASFETTLAMPLNTSEHSFSCSQAEGTPTPENPIPITGVSEITAYRTGKNLLPNKKRQRSSYSVNIGTDNVNNPVFLKAGTYTLNVTANISGLTAYYSGNNTQQKSIGSSFPITFTIDKDDYFLLWVYKNGEITVDDVVSFQLELGSTATPYEPYNGESITVSLGGTYYGGKLVQSEDGSRKLVLDKAFTKISALTWTYVPSFTYFNALPTNIKVNSDAGKKLDGLMCDIYTNRTAAQAGSGDVDLSIAAYQTTMRIKHKAYTDVNSFIAAVGDHDIVYPLETPIEINLPNGDPLTTIAGENNVYCNTGDTALTYYYNMVADPIRIPALVGTNNVYSDAGDVDVEYYTTLEGGND